MAEVKREELEIPKVIPAVPLRDFIIFPFMRMPMEVGREKSIKAVDAVASDHRMFVTVMQKDKAVNDPSPDDLYQIGTAVVIERMLRLPDGRISLIVRGLSRVRIDEWVQTQPYLVVRLIPLAEPTEKTVEVQALVNNVLELIQRMAQLSPQLQDVYIVALNAETPGQLADMVASILNLDPHQRQQFLEIVEPAERLRRLLAPLRQEIEVLEVSSKIQEETRKEMDKAQREFILRQQLREIQKELGEGEQQEIEELRKKIEGANMPPPAKEAAERELDRLSKMHPSAAEYTVSRTYLDWLIALPWSVSTEDNLDLQRAQQILDEDHYDLEDVKERIIEFLAVRKLIQARDIGHRTLDTTPEPQTPHPKTRNTKQETRSPILCFVGPPGTGKTSLGQSIARALGRKFIRMSLGGMRDEAEIRGHRRTYVGALPGRILQGIRNAGTNNPVFMLDEIDKLGMDFRGDPAAALLEVLDPEQNHSFVDHYLDVPFDLSKVMFITTANILDTIPPALLDRMEVLRLPGYTHEEKFQIARRYLIPRNLDSHGLKEENLSITDEALHAIIQSYTREAGLRNLDREIANICRKVARQIAEGKKEHMTVTEKDLEELLGPPKFFEEEAERKAQVGVATGLAWTPTGGAILFVETTKMPGKGNLIITGQLGDVMRESAEAALSYVRSRSEQLGIPEDFFSKHDIHIHVPAGAVPKDGPSAGITMATALASLVTGRPVRHDLAMTGEITLTGRVLPIGGVKEKVLAARQAGIKKIILPAKNRKDLTEVPEHVRKDIEFSFVDEMDDVLNLALAELAVVAK